MNAVTRILADIADREGLWATDLAMFPEILERHGLEPDDYTHATASRADHYNQDQFRLLVEKYRANQPYVTPEYTESQTDLTKKRSHAILLGHPVTAVIRWMGGQGWSVDQAEQALSEFGVTVSPNTLRCALRHGKKGLKEPAKLTKHQIAMLEMALL